MLLTYKPVSIFFLRACLPEGGGSQVGEVTCRGSPRLTCKRDHIKMKNYMDRRVTPPKGVISPTRSPPLPCKQALNRACFNLVPAPPTQESLCCWLGVTLTLHCFIRRVETLTKEKSESERLKMEVEAAYRTLQYKHDQESEARRVSEALHNQLKEQITRAEDKLAKYVYTNTMGVG